FRPIRLRPWASPTVVVDLPSPSGVGLIAVTTTYLPRGFAASSRSIPARVTLALVCPYGSISSAWRPRSRATSMIGRGVTERAIGRDDEDLCLRHMPREVTRPGVADRHGRVLADEQERGRHPDDCGPADDDCTFALDLDGRSPEDLDGGVSGRGQEPVVAEPE